MRFFTPVYHVDSIFLNVYNVKAFFTKVLYVLAVDPVECLIMMDVVCHALAYGNLWMVVIVVIEVCTSFCLRLRL